MVAEWIEASEMLGPGVYVLWLGGRLRHVGWAKSVLARVATHRRMCNQHCPNWMPIKGIKFDRVAFYPCTEYQSAGVIDRLKTELGYENAAAA